MHRSNVRLIVWILLLFAIPVAGCAAPQEKLETTVNLNLASEPISKTLTLSGLNFDLPLAVETWRFGQGTNTEQIDPITLEAVTTLDLPAESVTLYVVCDCGPR